MEEGVYERSKFLSTTTKVSDYNLDQCLCLLQVCPKVKKNTKFARKGNKTRQELRELAKTVTK